MKKDNKKRLFEVMQRVTPNFTGKALNETGEWNDEDEDLVAWKETLRDAIITIAAETGGKLKLIDIQGFDKYQGPYATVDIDGKKYDVWTMEDQGVLWIEDFPYDNTSGPTTKAGFEGTIPEIINVVNNTGEAPRNQMYNGFSLNEEYDDATTKQIINTIINAHDNIQDIFEKLPIATEIPDNEAKVLMDAMKVLHELEYRYSNENYGIGAGIGKFNKQPNNKIGENAESQEFQRKIQSGEIWLDYYAPSDSEEYTDGETWYTRNGQQLRDPEEYNPYSDGYTPFGDEG